MSECVMFILGQLSRQRVYFGCLFDSNQNDVTAIPDYEFNSTQASNTYSFLGTGLWETENNAKITVTK